MMKSADSVVMTNTIATLRDEGNLQVMSAGVNVSELTIGKRLNDYSYFQSGSSGCLRSQSGRRLFTSGSFSKLYSAGGDAVAHSRVQASHGSSPAFLPFQ